MSPASKAWMVEETCCLSFSSASIVTGTGDLSCGLTSGTNIEATENGNGGFQSSLALASCETKWPRSGTVKAVLWCLRQTDYKLYPKILGTLCFRQKENPLNQWRLPHSFLFCARWFLHSRHVICISDKNNRLVFRLVAYAGGELPGIRAGASMLTLLAQSKFPHTNTNTKTNREDWGCW